MGAELRIEGDDAYALATRLVALTGESLDTAVTIALRERVEREEKERDHKARVDRIMALAADLRAHLDGPVSSADHADLYGEDGLPA